MQNISPETQQVINSGTQTVLPKVDIEWINSRSLKKVKAWSTSDVYSTKTMELDPQLYWRMNDRADYTSYVNDDNPIAYWRLGNNGSAALQTQTVYSSGFRLSDPTGVALANGVTPDGDQAIRFNGSQYMRVERRTDSLNQNDVNLVLQPKINQGFTIEMWVRPETATLGGSRQILAAKSQNIETHTYQGITWLFAINGNKLQFAIFNKAQTALLSVFSQTSLANNTWYHVVATWDGVGTAQLFVNGTLERSKTISTAAKQGIPNYTAVVHLGALWNKSNTLVQYYTGRMDELAFYNFPMSQSVAAEHYFRGRGMQITDSSPKGTVTIVDTSGVPTYGGDSPLQGNESSGAGSIRFGGNTGVYYFAGQESVTPDSSDFSIEFWTRIQSYTSATEAIVAKASGTANTSRAYEVMMVKTGSAASVQGNVYIGSTKYSVSASGVPLNEFVHVAFQRNGGNIEIYLNGVLGGSTAVTGTVNAVGVFAAAQLGQSTTSRFFGDIAELAYYQTAWFDEKIARTRYLSGILASDYAAAGVRFSAKQAANGQKEQTFNWAVLDAKDSGGNYLYPDGSVYVGEAKPSQYDTNIYTELEYGYMSQRNSDGSGSFGVYPDLLVVEFEQISAPSIWISVPTSYPSINRYTVYYRTPAGAWVQAFSKQWPAGAEKQVVDLNASGSKVDMTAVALEIADVYSGNTPARVQEFSPYWSEDVSADVVSMSINKVKENNDTTVPVGITGANTLNLVLENTDLRYNKHNGFSDVSPFIAPDLEIKAGFVYTTGTSTDVPPPVNSNPSYAYGEGSYGGKKATTTTTPGDPPADPMALYQGMLGIQQSYDDRLARDIAYANNIPLVRVSVDFSGIFPSETTTNFSEADDSIGGALWLGRKVVCCLTYNPNWLGTYHGAPNNNQKWANRAGQIAARFAGHGVIYEIWNEPNLNIFWNSPDDAKYADLLQKCYVAIKTADPTAIVITGGTSPTDTSGGNINPTEWVTRLFYRGAGDYCDGVAHHPYSFPFGPDTVADWNSFLETERIHQVTVDFGKPKMIWGTEVSFPTLPTTTPGYLTVDPPDPYNPTPGYPDPTLVSEQTQAVRLLQDVAAWRDWPWAAGLIWFGYKDSDLFDHDTFGLVRADNSPKQAWGIFPGLADYTPTVGGGGGGTTVTITNDHPTTYAEAKTVGGGGGSVTIDTLGSIPQGTFWVDSWDISTDGMTATIAATDAVRFLQDTENTHGYMARNISGAQAVADIAKIGGAAHSRINIVEPYEDTIAKSTARAHWPMNDNTHDVKCVTLNATGVYIPEYWGTKSSTTIECWVKIDNVSADITGIWGYQNSNLRVETDGTLTGQWKGTSVGSSGTLENGKWHHVAMAVGSSSMNLFLDSNLVATGSIPSGTETDGGVMWWGAASFAGLPIWPMTGALSEPRIWNLKWGLGEAITYSTADMLGLEGSLVDSWDFASYHRGYFTNQSKGYNHIQQFDDNSDVDGAMSKCMSDTMDQSNGSYYNCELHQPGPFGDSFSRSVYFNGTDSYAYVNRQDFRLYLPNVSLEAWVKLTTTGQTQAIIARNDVGSVGGNEISMGVDSSDKIYVKRGSTTVITGTQSLQADTWYHVVFSALDFSGWIGAIYINGVIDTAFTPLTGNTAFDGVDKQWLIGRDGSGNYFNGYISNVAVYSYPLSDIDIYRHFRSGRSGKHRRFNTVWAGDSSLWDSQLAIATADLGMFNYNELDDFEYVNYAIFDTDAEPRITNVQIDLSEDTYISTGEYVLELMTNKVVVKVYPVQDVGSAKQQVWAAPDNESLAVTTLADDLPQSTSGEAAFLSYKTTKNTAGERVPLFAKSGYVKVGHEIIKFSDQGGSRLVNLERGQFGTATAHHFKGELVTEVKEYHFEWSDAPVYDVQRPFLTAEQFDNIAVLSDWSYNAQGGYARVSLNDRVLPSVIYAVLEGKNPVTQLDNFFHVAGVPAKTDRAAQQITEVSATLDDQIRQHKLKSLTIDSEFVQDAQTAKEIAQLILRHFEAGVPVIKIVTTGLPHLQLDDRVRITLLTALSIVNKEYWITEIDIDYDGGMKQTMTLREVVE